MAETSTSSNDRKTQEITPSPDLDSKEVHILMGHLQPLKQPGRLRRLGQKLSNQSTTQQYENTHFSQILGVFAVESDAQQRMQDLVIAKRIETDRIAPHDVLDPSTEKVGRGMQFKTTAGLQSYWMHSTTPEPNYGHGIFGITIEGSDGSSGSDESSVSVDRDQFEDQEVGNHEKADHEGEDRGLFDGKRIDRSSEQTIKRLDASGMWWPTR